MPPLYLSEYRYRHYGSDKESLKKSLVNLLICSLGKDHITVAHRGWFHSTAVAVRERLTADFVADLPGEGYGSWYPYHTNEELRMSLDRIGRGRFLARRPSPLPAGLPLPHRRQRPFSAARGLRVLHRAKEQVATLYGDREEWIRWAILNVAGLRWFSSDRSILEYAEQIWKVGPVTRA
jgi:hypothetical protein